MAAGPERGDSRKASMPKSAKDWIHFPTVMGGSFNAAAICRLFDPSAAAKTMRLRRANDWGVEDE